MYKRLLLAIALTILAVGYTVGCDSKPPITDVETIYELPLLEQIEPGLFAHVIRFESMFRSEQYSFNSTLIIDPDYYDNGELTRGDVVYFKQDLTEEQFKERRTEFDIGRVIGLPGESIRIDKGQVYINDHRLDTFYGKEFYQGEFINGTKRASSDDEILIPEGHYFLAGDL